MNTIKARAGLREEAGAGTSNAEPAKAGTPYSRFTIDGSEGLEQRIAGICEQVRVGIQRMIPPRKLHALVLAGGYGRGEGGVLRTDSGDEAITTLNSMSWYAGHACGISANMPGSFARWSGSSRWLPVCTSNPNWTRCSGCARCRFRFQLRLGLGAPVARGKRKRFSRLRTSPAE